MGDMEGQNDWDPWLVEGVIGSAGGAQLQKISTKDMSFIQPPQESQWGERDKGPLPGTPCPTVPP